MVSFITRALVSGTIAAAGTTLVAALAGRRRAGSYVAPINATSHVIWGDEAGQENVASLKYTGTGLLLNHGASIFWALFYEMLAGGVRIARGRALLDGVLVSAVAYIIDYHIVPKRLTPGFEKRLPGKALTQIYAALAAGLCVRDLLTREPVLKAKAEQTLSNIRSLLTRKHKRVLH